MAFTRCGELRPGAYFACSEYVYYNNECWMKIRRGAFSSAHLNGYLRVELDATAPRERAENGAITGAATFKHLHRLPCT